MFLNSKAGEEKLYQFQAFIKLLYHVEQYVTIINNSYIHAFVTVCHENSIHIMQCYMPHEFGFIIDCRI